MSETSESVRWEHLHPLTPILRGGLGALIVLGIAAANLRDRLVEMLWGGDAEYGAAGQYGPDEVDLFMPLPGTGIPVIVALLAALVLVLVVFVLFAWLSWYFSTFRVTAECVEARSGVLAKKHRRAPLERIQSVNVQRALLARLLGMAKVEIVTAGQGGTVELAYLGSARATALREHILRRVAAARVGVRTGVDVDESVVGFGIAEPVTQPPLQRHSAAVQVPPQRLLASIALDFAPFVVLFLAVLVWVSGSVWSMGVGVVPLGIAFVGIAVQRVNRGWNFSLAKERDELRVAAGLTATFAESIPLGRIHAVVVQQPLLWRFFGWWRVRVTTAGHSAAQSGQGTLQNIVLPVGTASEARALLEMVLSRGTLDTDLDAALRAAMVGTRNSAGSDGFVSVAGRAAVLLWWGVRRSGLRLVHCENGDGEHLVLRRGVLLRSAVVMPLRHAQSVQCSISVADRLLGLARLRVHTVLGPVSVAIRGLDRGRALQLFVELERRVLRAQSTRPAGGDR